MSGLNASGPQGRLRPHVRNRSKAEEVADGTDTVDRQDDSTASSEKHHSECKKRLTLLTRLSVSSAAVLAALPSLLSEQ